MKNLFLELPKYKGTKAIQDGLIDYMIRQGSRPGDAFLSDREVMEATGRSRTAVRRALAGLQEEGWIERRGGIGTFVGQRIVEVNNKNGETPLVPEDRKKVLRIGVLMDTISSDVSLQGFKFQRPLASHWYFSALIDGLNARSVEENLVVELLGGFQEEPETMRQRLELCLPDLLVAAGPPLHQFSTITEATRRGIPAILATVRMPEIGLPNIYEDHLQALHLAVGHLVEKGHRRIGFLQVLHPSGWWTIDRYQGYLQACRDFHTDQEQGLACWVPIDFPPDGSDVIRQWLRKEQPTAVVLGSFHAAVWLRELIQLQELVIPRDLSVIVFDQYPFLDFLFGGVQPATIELPLYEQGIEIARRARSLALHSETVFEDVLLPCHLREGDSVRQI